MRSSSKPEDSEAARSEAKAAFHLRLRARGVRDLGVLRAFEIVPREMFVPLRLHALAVRDLPLPIDCGQTMPEPWLVARMVEALGVAPSHRILEIGAGTGYVTTILSSLAADVVAFERYQSLAVGAQARLDQLAIENAAILWGDGLAVPDSLGTFERIIAHGLLEDVPGTLLDRLAKNGILVCARKIETENDAQWIVQIEKDESGAITETIICPSRLQPIMRGVAAAL